MVRSAECARDDATCLQAFLAPHRLGDAVAGTYNNDDPQDVALGAPPTYRPGAGLVAGYTVFALTGALALAVAVWLAYTQPASTKRASAKQHPQQQGGELDGPPPAGWRAEATSTSE